MTIRYLLVTTKMKIQPDAFLSECPSRGVLSRVGEKWALLVLVKLSEGPMHFGQMRRSVQGVSQKMLTQTLRSLERDGLLTRHVLDERPIRVEYTLTNLGCGLLPLLQPVKTWAEQNLVKIGQQNKAYDKSRASESSSKTRTGHRQPL